MYRLETGTRAIVNQNAAWEYRLDKTAMRYLKGGVSSTSDPSSVLLRLSALAEANSAVCVAGEGTSPIKILHGAHFAPLQARAATQGLACLA